MSDSTSNLDLLTAGQAQKETTQNALNNSASPAMLFARRESTTTALSWGYYGGKAIVAGISGVSTINNGTIALSASSTNYIESTDAGAVSKNTTGFTPGSIPLYAVVTGSASVTSHTDHRVWGAILSPRASVVITSDANRTLTQSEARADILDVTSSVSLTTTRNVVVPLAAHQWTVANLTTGGQSIQIIGATGTGVTIAAGKRATVYSDGTNIVQVADPASYATAAQGALADSAVQPGDLGTAADLDVPATGDAGAGEVVIGSDTRLSNARAPTSHTHTLSAITDAGTMAAQDADAVAITGGSANLTTLSEASSPAVVQSDIGSEPNQIPLNLHLLRLAYMDTAMVPVPASATAAGRQGDIAQDGSYLYICTAADTWKRVAISTW